MKSVLLATFSPALFKSTNLNIPSFAKVKPVTYPLLFLILSSVIALLLIFPFIIGYIFALVTLSDLSIENVILSGLVLSAFILGAKPFSFLALVSGELIFPLILTSLL